MGCGASRYDANGVASPARLRPFFLHKLEVFKLRRNSQAPLMDPSSTHNSKKVLLMHDSIEDIGSASKHEPLFFDARKSASEEASDKEKVNKIEDELTDGEFEDVEEEEEEEEEEEDYDERMLRNDGPGSPSFRVYVKDDSHREDDNNYVIDDSFEDAVSSKESCGSNDESISNKKIAKKGRKMRSFKNVLPKGGQTAVKNLLNVKFFYNSSNSTLHRAHFLTHERATA